jgi:ribosome-associated protein
MAKLPAKKTASRKSIKPSPKKNSRTKSTAVKKSSVKKKEITEKEREVRAANLIANSEKKKKTVSKRPKKTSTPLQTTGLLDAVVDGMREKKARNIMILDLGKLENRVTDYFVICDADSNIHVKSIADGVEEIVEKMTKERAYHTEGHLNGEWILLDYINVVVHVFQKETREHYNIEALWGDAAITLIND